MPLPAAWHPVPDVGAARGQGSGADACAHPQIGGVLWCSQSEYRQIHTRHVREVRRPHFREFSEEAPAASLARQAHGGRPGQRQMPPRNTAKALACEVSGRAQPAISATVQSAAGSYRASLEAGPAHGNAQPILRHLGRTARSSPAVLRPLATIQLSAA
jgi:hypothetical protein